MDQYYQPQSAPQNSSFALPPHQNKMIWAVLVTIFCCLAGGIGAIIYASKSNSAYNSALITNDDAMKQNLYFQSEQNNKTANTWIIVSVIVGLIVNVIYVISYVSEYL